MARAIGSICKIRLRDFMTYHEELELTPGSHLNVILGPNGSGKSTLVTAIVVGLGGNLRNLRRQEKLSDLISVNSTSGKASIELHLRKDETDVHVVECIIHKQAKYKVDGRSVTRQDVVALAERLNIQTDNPCQFLPQDVVGAFPDLRPEKVFDHTIKALGDADMLWMNGELLKAEERCRFLENHLEAKRSTLLDLEGNTADFQRLITELREKEKTEKDIEFFSEYVKYLEVIAMKKTLKQQKMQIVELLKEKHQVKQNLETAMTDVEKNRAIEEQWSVQIEALIGKIHGSRNEDALIFELERLDRELATVTAKLNATQGRQKDCLAELQSVKSQLKHDVDDAEQLQKSYDDARTTHSLKIAEVERLEVKKQNLLLELNELRVRGDRINSRKMPTEFSRRLRLLQKLNPDAFEGVKWLKKHQKKFNSPVNIPVMCLLELRNPDDAIYLEKLIGSQDLEAFVCEDPKDATELMRVLREENHLRRINVIYSANTSASELPQKPRTAKFKSFISDLFECPPAVMNYLCRTKNLHKIPVFDHGCDEVAARREFPKFFTEKTLHTVRLCRYSKTEMADVEDCTYNHCRHFVRGADNKEGGCYEEELTHIMAKEKEISDELSSVEANLQAGEKEEKALAEAVEIARRNMDERHSLELRLEGLYCQEKMMSSASTEGHVDLNGLRESRLSLEKERTAQAMKVVEAAKLREDAKTRLNKLYLQRKSVKDKIESGLRDKEAASGKLDEMEVRWQVLQDSFHSFGKRVIEERNKLTWEDREILIIPSDICDRARMECTNHRNLPTVKAKLKCLQENLSHTLNHYSVKEWVRAQQLTKKQAMGKEEVEQTDTKLQETRASFCKLEETLRSRVEELVSEVDAGFSQMMSGLGFSGQVSLRLPSEHDKLRGFGIDILVKFVEGERSLVKLSRNVQSGGEKSLTTALYLLALQRMTDMPFRCIDEINQGMDERNERGVWDLLLETARFQQAQYFYFAPKFPRRLAFDADMTVLVCYNGTVSKKRVATTDPGECLEKKKKRRMAKSTE